jgi:hypothetical protein
LLLLLRTPLAIADPLLARSRKLRAAIERPAATYPPTAAEVAK